jgi:hypothetical protein
MMPVTLTVLHGTDTRMELIYFLVSVMTVLLPVTIFTAIAVLMVKGMKRERAAAKKIVEQQRGGLT